MAALGSCMVLAQACFLQAVKRADASFVVAFFYATLVFAALYDLAVFGVVPRASSILGAGLIIGGAITLAWRERHHRRCPGRAAQGK
jgi:drug/metabolite transporter (DMT)-like permease